MADTHNIIIENVTHDLTDGVVTHEINTEVVTHEIGAEQGPPGPPGIGIQGIQGVKGDQGEKGEAGTGDATYTYQFTFTNSVTVPHPLNKKPSIQVIDSSGRAYGGYSYNYDSDSQVTVSWMPMFTGYIILN